MPQSAQKHPMSIITLWQKKKKEKRKDRHVAIIKIFGHLS